MPVLPMFPLGTVLFPSALLPLHVFEPRYRALVADCLAGDGELGVVLIERGSEVGGGDVRTAVGTVARIIEAAELDDGRWALMTVGTRRIRVKAWLDDEPYPRADVEDWPDPEPQPGLHDAHEDVLALLRRALAMKAELGDQAHAASVELASDAVLAGYQAAALAPVGPLDKQRLLAAASPAERASLLRELLADEVEVLALRLSGA